MKSTIAGALIVVFGLSLMGCEASQSTDSKLATDAAAQVNAPGVLYRPFNLPGRWERQDDPRYFIDLKRDGSFHAYDSKVFPVNKVWGYWEAVDEEIHFYITKRGDRSGYYEKQEFQVFMVAREVMVAGSADNPRQDFEYRRTKRQPDQ